MTSYTGDVNPGGPADVAELEALTLRKLAVSAMHNNVYLLTCRATGEQLLVDAADEAPRLLELVAEGTGRLDHLVTTHRHQDHTRALAEVARATGATTWAGTEDAAELPISVDATVGQGDTIAVGEVVLDVIHLRGHTPGSIALAHTEPDGSVHLLSGDSLFPGGVGNTQMFDYQDFDSLYADVVARVFDVYADAHVYPGHGADTTLATERPHLAEWRERGW